MVSTIRCHSGFNRSGLVVVQALGHLGYGVDDAISLVRHRRSQWANPLLEAIEMPGPVLSPAAAN
jgi:protein-tyrosine phosphatase